MEGDKENARYWYGRAKRAFSDDVQAEIAAARAAIRQPSGRKKNRGKPLFFRNLPPFRL